jgi:hypothetical protein
LLFWTTVNAPDTPEGSAGVPVDSSGGQCVMQAALHFGVAATSDVK